MAKLGYSDATTLIAGWVEDQILPASSSEEQVISHSVGYLLKDRIADNQSGYTPAAVILKDSCTASSLHTEVVEKEDILHLGEAGSLCMIM